MNDTKNKSKSESRFRHENGKIVVDIAVKNVRQLFDARDPAPFRERDLDDDLVDYILSFAQEFPLNTPMSLAIHFSDESESGLDMNGITSAIHSFFLYESESLRRKLRNSFRTARFFLVIGLVTLITCVSIAELMASMIELSALRSILREGLVISGWVAMWRPIEVFLYDWWPIREKTKYYEKLAQIEIKLLAARAANQT